MFQHIGRLSGKPDLSVFPSSVGETREGSLSIFPLRNSEPQEEKYRKIDYFLSHNISLVRRTVIRVRGKRRDTSNTSRRKGGLKAGPGEGAVQVLVVTRVAYL